MAEDDRIPGANGEEEQPAGEEEKPAGEQAAPGATAEGAPDEQELRRRLEDELRKLRIEDVVLQSVVSLINLTSRRIAKPDEQDLEQARVGIEAVRALAGVLDEETGAQVRQALSELQVAYAREAGGGGGAGESEGAGAGEASPAPEQARRRGQALLRVVDPSGRVWLDSARLARPGPPPGGSEGRS
jgi:hypothetical protein